MRVVKKLGYKQVTCGKCGSVLELEVGDVKEDDVGAYKTDCFCHCCVCHGCALNAVVIIQENVRNKKQLKSRVNCQQKRIWIGCV